MYGLVESMADPSRCALRMTPSKKIQHDNRKNQDDTFSREKNGRKSGLALPPSWRFVLLASA
jgi:hypothetical protein